MSGLRKEDRYKVVSIHDPWMRGMGLGDVMIGLLYII